MAEWLTIIGLTEYADNFTQNHINGKILFDLTEKEVKEDLQIISIGHRKNFHKAVQHLKKFYSKNRLYSDSIKNKLIKFYEKHSQQLKIGKKNFSFFDIKNDIIHEDNDEISYKESPAVMNIKHETNNNNNIIEGEDFQLDIYEEDAVLHFNEKLVKSKSKKKKNFITGKKFDDEDVPNSRKLSPVFSKESDSKSVKTLEEISKIL